MGQSPSTPAPPPTAPSIPMGHLMPPPTPMDVHGPGAMQGQPTTFIASGHEVRAAEQRLPPVHRDPPPRNLVQANIAGNETRFAELIAQAQASGPFGPSVTDDVNRYKHDGTQPMRDKATPSHKAGVEWTIKH